MKYLLFLFFILQVGCADKKSSNEVSLTGAWAVENNSCSNSFTSLSLNQDGSLETNTNQNGAFNFSTGAETLNNYWSSVGFPERAIYNKAIISNQTFSINYFNEKIELTESQTNCKISLNKGIN